MSRYGIYRVRIDVFGYDPQKCGDIARVISYSWKNVYMLELCENNVSSLRFDGEGYLSMGETEHEFCEKISERIDIVNDAPCKVKIKMLYLDSSGNDDIPAGFFFESDSTCEERLTTTSFTI